MARTYNLADLFESVVDVVPSREAIVDTNRRLTFAALDERANRLAHHLTAAGIGPGSHVGLQLLNGSEYIEGMIAAFKIRAVPVNVNYRYVAHELQHLFTDADLAALIVHRRFVPAVGAVATNVLTLRSFVVVDDGTADDATLAGAVEYEPALASQ